jgi:hypothetical protein
MEPIDPTTENERRFEEYQLGLESLNSKELSFVVNMAHMLREMQKGKDSSIVINNYAVNTDKFIIIMEHKSNLNE